MSNNQDNGTTTETAEKQDVLYDVTDHVATITFNRPEIQNTISHTMLTSLSEMMLEADKNTDVRAVIITGTKKFFCAGLDLRGSSISDNLADSDATPTNLDLRNAPPMVLHNMDTPTIASLNGSAAGYGLDLALGCDIRIMADTAKLAAAFTARGVVPESGGTWILPRLIGWSKAAELIFTAKKLNAQEAVELGLVSRAVPRDDIEEEAVKLAQAIAKNAPLAVQASKRMMRMGMNETYNDHIHHVYLQLLPLFKSKDFKEGVASFMEKRDPNFIGR